MQGPVLINLGLNKIFYWVLTDKIVRKPLIASIYATEAQNSRNANVTFKLLPAKEILTK